MGLTMNKNYAKLIALPLVVFMALLGCPGVDKPQPKTVVDLVGYSLALDKCKALGKDAGSYDVYEDCAQKADSKYGKHND